MANADLSNGGHLSREVKEVKGTPGRGEQRRGGVTISSQGCEGSPHTVQCTKHKLESKNDQKFHYAEIITILLDIFLHNCNLKHPCYLVTHLFH